MSQGCSHGQVEAAARVLSMRPSTSAAWACLRCYLWSTTMPHSLAVTGLQAAPCVISALVAGQHHASLLRVRLFSAKHPTKAPDLRGSRQPIELLLLLIDSNRSAATRLRGFMQPACACRSWASRTPSCCR